MDEDDKKLFVRVSPIKVQVSAEQRMNIMRGLSLFVARPGELDTQPILPFAECQRRLHEIMDAARSQKKLVEIPVLVESKKNVTLIAEQSESKNVTLIAEQSESKNVTLIAEQSESKNVTLIAEQSESKDDVKEFIRANIEGDLAAWDVKPKLRLSQKIIEIMESTQANVPRQVTFPREKRLPPRSTTNKKLRKVLKRTPPIPRLGRPYRKKIVPASKGSANCVRNTFQKRQFVYVKSQPVGNGFLKKGTMSKNLSDIEDMENTISSMQIKTEPLDDTIA